MRNIVKTYVERFKREKQTRRRLAGIVGALALVVVLGVFWQLHYTGVAMANETFCGEEEHRHDESCYEKQLVCGEEESTQGHTHSEDCYDEDGVLICGLKETAQGHTHDDSCYEDVLVCDLEEHTHTTACLVDDTADVETAADWEATLPELTGVWADDVAAVAASQIGYTESESNFQLAEDEQTRQGYTRYGAWYGNEYGDWDAMFASFCLNYAGVPAEDFPEAAGAYAWIAALEEQDLYEEASDAKPAAGDLIFMDQDEDGQDECVGIIEKVETGTDESGEAVLDQLVVVEGNYEDAVQENTYNINDACIIGYGTLPEQSAVEKAEKSASDETKSASGTKTASGIKTVSGTKTASDAESVSETDTEIEAETKDAGKTKTKTGKSAETEAAEDPTTLTYEGADYIVTVTYEADAKLPEETELAVSEYEKDSETYLARYAEAAKMYGWNEEVEENDSEAADVGSLMDIRLFNISLLAPNKNGNMEEVEPAAPVQVTISYLSAEEDEDGYMVTHFGDETETMDIEASEEDGAHNLTFDVEGFSDFLVSGISEDDYGIMTLGVSGGSEYFDFISMDATLSAHHGSGVFEPDSGVDYILDNGNYFHLIDENTKHVTEEHMFTLGYDNLDKDNLPELFSLERNPDASQNDDLLLLDISSISGGNTPSTDVLDNNVQGEGYTFNNVGTLTFENAGTVAGNIPVDVQITFDSIRLYNCFSATAQEDGVAINSTVPINQKLHVANFGGGDTSFWISQNYTSSRKDGYENGYSYPVNLDVNMTINIVYAGTNNTVDMSFLMAASDIDGYQANARHGWYKETFKTLDRFNGNYYIYPSDADFIASYSTGVVTAQSGDSEQNYNGDDAYTLGGIYADSATGEFQVGYSEGWCGTRVEIYDYTSNDITIEKQDVEDESTLLDGAEFIVYKDVSAGDQDYPYVSGDPEYGVNDPVRIYYQSEKTTSEGTVIEAEWSTNPDDAKHFRTGEEGDDYKGKAFIRCLYPCENYYIEEVTAPDGGYSLLNAPIEFELTSYGTIILKNQSDYVSLDGEDELKLIVQNATGQALPNTGGPGTWTFTIFGLILIGGAAVLLYCRRRAVRA